MSTSEILPALWRRRITFAVTFMLVMAAVAAITVTSPKVYSTVSYLIVSQSRPSTSGFEATQVNEVLTRTFAELLQTRRIAEAVVPSLPYRTTVDDVLGAVEVQAVSQSQLLSITAEGPSPRRAQIIADTYAGTFVRKARELTAAGGNTAVISVAQSAALVTEPSRPQPLLYLAIGAVLAALLAAALALLRQRMDQRLEVGATTTHVFDVPVIGYVPRVSSRRDHRAARQSEEAFRLVLANLSFANGGVRPGSLAVVSSGEGEGKTAASFSLARVAAELGVSVLLVDGDLRRPAIASEAERAGIDVSQSAGLGHHLASSGSPALSTVAVPVAGTSLSIVPSKPTPGAPALLSSKAMIDFVELAEEAYDLVIIDSPPLTVGPDASLIAELSAGALFVIDAQRTRRNQAKRAIDQLRRTDTSILGIALNRIADISSSSYYADGPHGRAGAGPASPVPARTTGSR